jgi:hypothetical protein
MQVCTLHLYGTVPVCSFGVCVINVINCNVDVDEINNFMIKIASCYCLHIYSYCFRTFAL